MPTYPLQLTCLGVIYGTPLLASIFVALRIYTRRKLSLRLSWDDWLIIVPLLLSIALIGPSHRHVKMWHVGVHIWEVSPEEIEPDYDEYYAVVMAFNLLNIPILPLVKASIILLLLRAGSVIEWLKKILYAILIFTIGSALIPWFLYIFICPPLTGNTWGPRTFGGLHCMGRHRMGEMLIWVTCANLLTDVLILPIPFIIVRRMMSARLRSRLVVLAVFTCSLAVTAIGAAKIYLSYRDRLYTLFKPDWTYPIDYCINHIENNVAIIVANIPILRGLVTRWVFNFKTKATPLEREFRGDWQCNTSNSSDISRYARKNRVVQKILPCIQDDFSSSLATRSGGDIRPEREPHYPPRVVATGEYRKKGSYFPRSRRNSLDRYEKVNSCEKGDMLETIGSIGSLGSAPTLVESKDIGNGWKNMDSPPLSPTRRISTTTLSPITPLTPCRLRGIEDDEDDEDDKIYPYHARL
ncbi:uncharacterized protein K460DRAFT_325217 [Cucurbitaria berberidis CBS 394.84]|uniref:Rhodopsin domain-containing protein n=1 Tax=Cucurbitaria berberidis CBS 394.84 TaxID=1168544 RepID=A0A9P4GSE1_9PLEO|nr:uncharacterized protein K460DRAFT_325217 [Cucurbitaria berberidis CBS 394.84]KAF1851883.1 hypothetical protein K460DRAFT_325217 [Cucurbitaria berberidis CBS 394.84]